MATEWDAFDAFLATRCAAEGCTTETRVHVIASSRKRIPLCDYHRARMYNGKAIAPAVAPKVRAETDPTFPLYGRKKVTY